MRAGSLRCRWWWERGECSDGLDNDGDLLDDTSDPDCTSASDPTEGTELSVHTDHLGTPRMLTDASGAAVWRAHYEAFGRAQVSDDPDGNPVTPDPGIVFNIRFPGQYYDAETETAGPGTGLHYNRFRYYDPSIGRYVSADPIGQFALTRDAWNSAVAFDSAISAQIPFRAVFSLRTYPEVLGVEDLFGGSGSNVYVYAEDSPTELIDPLGLGVWDWIKRSYDLAKDWWSTWSDMDQGREAFEALFKDGACPGGDAEGCADLCRGAGISASACGSMCALNCDPGPPPVDAGPPPPCP